MATSPTRQNDPITQFDEALTLLENQRTEELINAQRYQEINHLALEKEQARLSQKYGEDHPKVQKIAARLAYNQTLFTGINQEISRSKNRMPPLPENAWRVQGQVFDQANAPLSKQNVYLSDEQNEAIVQVGYACSDDGGYYAITITEKDIDALQSRKLYLTASDANRTVVYRSPEPLTAAKGGIELRNIYLGQKECTPPFTKKEKPASDEEYTVQGIISDQRKKPLPNLVVRAADLGTNQGQTLGEKATTNADGHYQISYHASEFRSTDPARSGADLLIFVYDQQGNELTKSEVFKKAAQTLTIDLMIGDRKG